MSIVLLAIEVIRKSRGGSSIATRKPYLISFVIGLIHGCGFASALSDIGLPKGTELLALLLFNLGVELGQIAIIALLLILLWLATKAAQSPCFGRCSACQIISSPNPPRLQAV
jgi:hypothetical protein